MLQKTCTLTTSNLRTATRTKRNTPVHLQTSSLSFLFRFLSFSTFFLFGSFLHARILLNLQIGYATSTGVDKNFKTRDRSRSSRHPHLHAFNFLGDFGKTSSLCLFFFDLLFFTLETSSSTETLANFLLLCPFSFGLRLKPVVLKNGAGDAW